MNKIQFALFMQLKYFEIQQPAFTAPCFVEMAVKNRFHRGNDKRFGPAYD